MMAAILNRPGLLAALEPELRRRARAAAGTGTGGTGVIAVDTVATGADRNVADAALGELSRGALIPDDRLLIRLLLGYSSAADVPTLAAAVPAGRRRTCSAWFPGGGAAVLPTPFAHILDRY
jgi:hypothetical protein